VKYAAFFRNVNLGRPHCPTKTQFEAAFMAAGATTASSFLTNGTLVFAAGSHGAAQKVLTKACAIMHESCGLKEPGYIRTLGYLAGLVSLDPFSAIDRDSVYECCTSFLGPGIDSLAPFPAESKRGDVKVLHVTGTEVFCVSLKVGNTPGSPNAFLEKHLGTPVTTRAWNTVVRLVQRHA